MKTLESNKSNSIIVLDKFILATRDSGYKGTASAIAELIDNAIQADANKISISIVTANNKDDELSPLEIHIQDNGSGMTPNTLHLALRFGGSSRFNDRKGMGRYGMGLPNSSLSQARRVAVYSWQSPNSVYLSYLDIDEIIAGDMEEVPEPKKVSLDKCVGPAGTLVAWSKCDRLDQKRVSTLHRKLAASLGRRFRYFIWKGIVIEINGEAVEAIDPLYLNPKSRFSGAKLFGEPLEYKISSDPSNPRSSYGIVHVTFTELPVHSWHGFSNEEKQKMGISKGAGVSVVRAGREIDYGGFFLKGKRKENYDDWWRCEIQFDPVLDEAFGITHTKQQVRPQEFLLEALSPDIETAARALNTRVRKSHTNAKASELPSEAEKIAGTKDKLLPVLPRRVSSDNKTYLEELKRRLPSLTFPANGNGSGMEYRIVEAKARNTAFFDFVLENGRLVLVLDPHHPFYKTVYKPLLDGATPREREMRTQLELILLAIARCEAAGTGSKFRELRLAWSHVLATFLTE